MRLELASAKDSDRLTEFFQRMILPGSMDISVHRQQNFFAQYRLSSDDFQTLMLLDENAEIQGVATLIFREGIIHSERQIIGFATDLRIAPTRHAVLQWAQQFLPVLEQALESRKCRYVFSAIERADHQAYNALIRPQHARRKLPRYYLLRDFHIVGILGRMPFSKRPLKNIRIDRLEMNTVTELCDYLRTKTKNRPFASIHTEENLLATLSRYPGLHLHEVRIARDSQGRIIGCTVPWRAGGTQSFVPMRYNGFAASAQQLARIASWTRIVQPLPAPGDPFRLSFMLMLNAEGPEVFYRLADDCLGKLLPGEILCYGHFRRNLTTLPPRGYICTALPYALYTLLPPETDLPEDLQPDTWRPPPEFEVAML